MSATTVIRAATATARIGDPWLRRMGIYIDPMRDPNSPENAAARQAYADAVRALKEAEETVKADGASQANKDALGTVSLPFGEDPANVKNLRKALQALQPQLDTAQKINFERENGALRAAGKRADKWARMRGGTGRSAAMEAAQQNMDELVRRNEYGAAAQLARSFTASISASTLADASMALHDRDSPLFKRADKALEADASAFAKHPHRLTKERDISRRATDTSAAERRLRGMEQARDLPPVLGDQGGPGRGTRRPMHWATGPRTKGSNAADIATMGGSAARSRSSPARSRRCTREWSRPACRTMSRRPRPPRSTATAAAPIAT